MNGGFPFHRRFLARITAGFLAVLTLVLGDARTFAADGEARALVWVLDGAGDLRGCSTSLSKTFADSPRLELHQFHWSHGYRRILLDQTDYIHARKQGERLAEAILDQAKSGRRLVIVAHSAGTAVALAAAEKLPPGSIDRLVLLAPSVSTKYDPRPAAKACKEGIDVFCSDKDVWALGVAMKLVGTTDSRQSSQAAGRFGFDGIADDRIRQYFWDKDWSVLGHTGGHYGCYAPNFARTQLLPLFLGSSSNSTVKTQYLSSSMSLDHR